MSRPAVLNETVLTFAEAAAACPAVAGKAVRVKSIYVWADSGVKGVKLETARVGGRRVTSREALDRFFTLIAGGEVAPPVQRTPTVRRSASEKAMDFLRSEFAKA